jgi:uncharacterized membrane protein YfcA
MYMDPVSFYIFDVAPLLIIAAIFLVAVLYSSVGHGGASGYLAVMALLSIPHVTTRPSALLLNVFVAGIGTIQFYRSGHFSWRTFLPFAATSIPFAFIGGTITLPAAAYKIVLGAVLVAAAIRLAWNLKSDAEVRDPNIAVALAVGAAIGLLSGLIGVGGGIFLTPVLLLMNWSETKTAAGVSAMFILVNSVSGLAGNYPQLIALGPGVFYWIAAAIAGGAIGSTLGAKRFDSLTLRRMLAVVLLFAGVKLVLV